MKVLANLAFVVLCCLFYFVQSEEDLSFCKTPNVREYYWREYVGVIPPDAVPGGVDKNGFTTYIGHATIHPFGSLTATITRGEDKALTTAAAETRYVDRNVKILCSNNQVKLNWIRTDVDKIQRIKDCHLIVGGVNNGVQENIGRVNFNDDIVLGRVTRLPSKNHGLHIPNNKTEIRFTNFEVLGYDCNHK